MNHYRVRAFGITKDILGAREKHIEVNGQTVAALREALLQQYSELKGLRSLLIAVNDVYADDSTVLSGTDEIALIPPVSGG